MEFVTDLKLLLHQEGPRDHVDMLKGLAALPNVVISNIANMVVAHGRNRGFNVFGPHEGRVALATAENIKKAEDCELRVDWPWFPNGVNGQRSETFQRNEGEQLLRNPATGSCEDYSLFDPFKEKNSTNPADVLRRVACVRQLTGKTNLETAEQLNNMRNRDNYFTTSLTAHNSIFVEWLVAHFSNEKLNKKVYRSHIRQFGTNLQLNAYGQIVIIQQHSSSREEPLPKIARLGQNGYVGNKCSSSCSLSELSPIITTSETATPSLYYLENQTPNSTTHGRHTDHNANWNSYPNAAGPNRNQNPSRNSTNLTRNLNFNPNPSTGPHTSQYLSTRSCNSNPNPSRNIDPNQIATTSCFTESTASTGDGDVDSLVSSAPLVEGSSREDILFVRISNTSVRCWIFPPAIALSKIDNRINSGNFSCTIISLILGKMLLTLSVKCPDDGTLSELWYGLIVKCTRLGIEIYDSSCLGARNLSPNEASSTLRNVSQVDLQPPVRVRFSDSDICSRLSFQICKLREQSATALLIYSQRTVLLYITEDGVMLIDNHQHGETMGPIIVKGTCSRLPEFLNSIQNTLNLNENSYAELIVFS